MNGIISFNYYVIVVIDKELTIPHEPPKAHQQNDRAVMLSKAYKP